MTKRKQVDESQDVLEAKPNDVEETPIEAGAGAVSVMSFTESASSEKTTISIDKATAELVRRVKRKMSFDTDQDLKTDETIYRLCKAYLEENESNEN